jgi:heme/copper-type cytochrome/quinol oxidase subunit 4
MILSGAEVAGGGIFVVVGGALITYGLLTRETGSKYAMNKIWAAFYALAIGSILFAVYTAIMGGIATNEMYIAIASLVAFSLAGIGLFLFLFLTENNRCKKC